MKRKTTANKKAVKQQNVAKRKTSMTFTDLQVSHREELERFQLQMAERIRQVESARLGLEDKLEKFEESYSELDERYRKDTQSLSSQLLKHQEEHGRFVAASSVLDEKISNLESLRDTLDAERQRLEVELRTRSSELGDAQKMIGNLEGERNALDAERQRLEGELRTGSSELGDAQKMIGNLEGELGARSSELRDMQSQLSSLNSRHKTANEEIERVSSHLEKEADRHGENLARLNAQVASLQEELHRHRIALIEAERRADAREQSRSYRLGNALIEGFMSWRGFWAIPGRVWKVIGPTRKSVALTKGEDSNNSEDEPHPESKTKLEDIFSADGLDASEAFARQDIKHPRDLASAFSKLARLSLRANPSEAVRLAREATELDPRPFRRKWLAFLLFDAGSITESNDLLNSLPDDLPFNHAERNKVQYVAGSYRLFTGPLLIPEASSATRIDSDSKSVLYVAASSLPHHITGYTLRTQGITEAISDHGWKVICVTRPGYPEDRPDSKENPSSVSKTSDGTRFGILEGPHRRKIALDEYILQSADIIAQKAKSENVALIHGASNYEVAIPSLIAARKLGIPFTYEVRGLWEYTAASKMPGWEATERFELDKRLETLAATQADQVFTLTRALAAELGRRGVDANRIDLAPNAIAPASFHPLARDKDLARTLGLDDKSFTIGYIGSIVAYEGLDDLVTAFGLIADGCREASLLIVGDGDALPALRRQVEESGLSERTNFAGRVSPSEVPSYFSLLNVIALPRKPLTVCKLVSPLKPFEAMAMEVPLVVSDVPALSEIVRDGETALVHEAGNPTALADCLTRLRDRDFADKLAQAARADVIKSNTWDKVADTICKNYTRLLRAEIEVSDT